LHQTRILKGVGSNCFADRHKKSRIQKNWIRPLFAL
jgi:hypothetical protein